MNPNRITLVAFMHAQPGTEEVLLTQIDSLVAQTRVEPGCINYDFHQHKTNSSLFVFYENFADQAAFDFHFTQPYTQGWIKFAEKYGARFDIQFYTMISKPGVGAGSNR